MIADLQFGEVVIVEKTDYISWVVYKFNVLIIFCVSRCCTEAKRHAAPPHGFPASSKRIRFFESVGLNDSLHWHWTAQHDSSVPYACQQTDGCLGQKPLHSLTSSHYMLVNQHSLWLIGSGVQYSWHCLAPRRQMPRLDGYCERVQSSSTPCWFCIGHSSITHPIPVYPLYRQAKEIQIAGWSLFFIHFIKVSGATPNKRCIPRRLPRSRYVLMICSLRSSEYLTLGLSTLDRPQSLHLNWALPLLLWPFLRILTEPQRVQVWVMVSIIIAKNIKSPKWVHSTENTSSLYITH